MLFRSVVVLRKLRLYATFACGGHLSGRFGKACNLGVAVFGQI